MTAGDGEISVTLSRQGAVATILVDRASKLNALTLPLLDQLRSVCDEVERSTARVVLIRTAGDRVFCVGADITHFAQLDPVHMWSDWIATGHRAFERLANLKQPTIAVIDGLALGGGLELALACDLRIVDAGARLGLPEAGLGTVPGWGGSGRLVEELGRGRAMELMLTRRQLSGEEAVAWGLATRAADAGNLEAAVDQLLDDVLASAPIASQLIKQLVAAAGQPASTRILEGLAGGLAATTSDLREGIDAFSEKRSPIFNGE